MGKWKTVYKTTGEATVRQFGKEHTIPATSVVQTRTRFTGSKVIKAYLKSASGTFLSNIDLDYLLSEAKLANDQELIDILTEYNIT